MGKGGCPAECRHQREQLDLSWSLQAWVPVPTQPYWSQGRGLAGSGHRGSSPWWSLLPPPSCLQSHPVPTQVTASSHSMSGVEWGIWGGGWPGGARAAPTLRSPSPPMGPSGRFPRAALPMASDALLLLALLCLEHPVPSKSLSQTSWEKGRGRRGRNFQGAGKGG